jgi:hypothetical protein
MRMLDRRVAGARRSRAVTASRSASSVRPSAERPPASSWTSRWYTSGTFGTAGSRASGSSRTRQSSARSWPPRLPQPHDAPAGAGGQMRPAGPPCRQGQRRPTAVRALRGPFCGPRRATDSHRPPIPRPARSGARLALSWPVAAGGSTEPPRWCGTRPGRRGRSRRPGPAVQTRLATASASFVPATRSGMVSSRSTGSALNTNRTYRAATLSPRTQLKS